MALMFTRAKRVSDPLNERTKARLLLGASDQYKYSDVNDPSFIIPTLIHGFFDVDDDPDPPHINSNGNEYSTTTSDFTSDDPTINAAAAVETLQDLLDPSCDPFCQHLHTDVIQVADAILMSNLRSDKYMHSVVAQLREIGYNAGVCHTKWGPGESSGGLTAGSYKYIDVVSSDEEEIKERYIVDLEFKGQFEVARQTKEYEKVVGSVPRVLVGREEEVMKAVKVVAEAAKRSMRRSQMSVPPWRKRRYLLSKWFGPYTRVHGKNVKCRSVVGFRLDAKDEINGRYWVEKDTATTLECSD